MKKLPNWIAVALKGAAILHFLLAAGLVFLADTLQLMIAQGEGESPGSTLWLQMAGIGLAIHGLGYLIASYNTSRNTVALFMGIAAMFAGLIFLPLHFGWSVFTNGLLAAGMVFLAGWAGFLVWMLNYISKLKGSAATLSYSYNEPLSKTLSRFRTQKGKNLLQLSNQQPVLVIFLHQFRNVLSRELLADIRKKQESIQERGTKLVFVHPESEKQAAAFFGKTKLEEENRISDPNGIMYQAFELEKAVFDQSGNWRSYLSQFLAGFRGGRSKGAIMPGAFLINRGKVMKSYRYGESTESPDFLSLASFEAA